MRTIRDAEVVRRRLGDLIAADYNPRNMPKSEMEKLKRSIREFGFVVPPVIRTDGTIVGGHQRVLALRELLLEEGRGHDEIDDVEIDVVETDVDDQKAKLLNIALNKIAGDWDYELLANLMRDLEDAGADVQLTGFDEREVEDILALIAKANPIPDPEPDGAEPAAEEAPKEVRRFAFVVDSDEEAVLVRTTLATFGMTKPTEAARAFLAMVQRAAAVGPAPARARRKRKTS